MPSLGSLVVMTKDGLSDSVYVLDYVKMQIDSSALVVGETKNESGTMNISKNKIGLTIYAFLEMTAH